MGMVLGCISTEYESQSKKALSHLNNRKINSDSSLRTKFTA